MRMFIYTGNHGNSPGISDTVLFLKYALQDCGIDACITPKIAVGQWNVVLEHFVDQAPLLEYIEAHRHGTRYIMIGSEPIIGGSFNTGVVSAHSHYSNTEYWNLRFRNFLLTAGMANAVWVLGERQVAPYQAVLPSVPVSFVPHGWVDRFATVSHRPESGKDIDFYFSGTMTEHRATILRELARTHVVAHNDKSTPEYIRFDYLSRSKVCLALRLSPNNVFPSVSRAHFHLQNRNFQLQETYEAPCPLDPYVLQAPHAEYVEFARVALALDRRREIADGIHDRFRSEMPMSVLLAPLLDRALSGTPQRTTAQPALQPA